VKQGYENTIIINVVTHWPSQRLSQQLVTSANLITS